MSGDITILGKTVTVRQLTMREVNDYLDSKPEPPTGADLLLNKDIPEKAVRLATGLTTEDLNGDVLPTDLEKLWDKVSEVNHFLDGLLRRLKEAGKNMLTGLEETEDLTDQALEK